MEKKAIIILPNVLLLCLLDTTYIEVESSTSYYLDNLEPNSLSTIIQYEEKAGRGIVFTFSETIKAHNIDAIPLSTQQNSYIDEHTKQQLWRKKDTICIISIDGC
jgi:hypothetical protein